MSDNEQELADEFKIDHPQLKKILACWFDLALENYLTITGLILQEKAKKIATALKIQNFATSNGWLQGFKKWYHIVYTMQSGEAANPVTIYDAIQFVSQAWNKVSKDIIIHIWQKTGILPFIEIDEHPDAELLVEENNKEEAELENLITQF
ncbi:8491_t:CDS:2 [Dentiscutata erythropus]|uniref:8491_t:CDS:1 n=1 Tax=Dentiscutata erythropus TaxID=1348616 RepID=A0A9N9DQ30_9GLOM|nr:8491_t:CDS:2 [Dentiscutata erythropus]